MRRTISSVLCATALLTTGVAVTVTSPRADAALGFRLSFNFFQDRLTPYGRWFHHPIWGDVWRPKPRLVGADFQPYVNGYWEYTEEYGWYWVSEDPFDDVVYHYGRWVYDPRLHWVWIPGYAWAPAWVAWREGDEYTGWMPLPPDEAFVSGNGFSVGANLGPIGLSFYRNWYGNEVDPTRFFVFVDNRHLVNRDYRRFAIPRERARTILDRTRDVGRFDVVNNRVVNRGIDVRIIERATGSKIAPVSARTVIKPNAVITTVGEADEIRQRERKAHPIALENLRHRSEIQGETTGPEKSAQPSSTPDERQQDSRPKNGAGGATSRASRPSAGDQVAPEQNASDRGHGGRKAANSPEGNAVPDTEQNAAGGGTAVEPKKRPRATEHAGDNNNNSGSPGSAQEAGSSPKVKPSSVPEEEGAASPAESPSDHKEKHKRKNDSEPEATPKATPD